MERGGGTGASLADLARVRQGAYRLLSALFLYPHEERLALAPHAARLLRRQGRWLARLAFFTPWETLLREVMALRPARLKALQRTYSRLFISDTPRKPIPLCGSAYVDPSVVVPGRVIAEVEGAYAGAGLRPSADAVAPDHAAVELEFVSFLCGQEAGAWASGDLGEVSRAISLQRDFLEAHLGRWFPSLARAIAAREGSGLYTLASQAAWALIQHDADFLRALASHLDREGRDRQK